MMLPVLKDFKNTKKYLVLQCIAEFCLLLFLQYIFYDATCFKRFQKYKKIFGFAVYCRILFAVVFAVNIL